MTKSREPDGDPPENPGDEPELSDSDDLLVFEEAPDDPELLEFDLTDADFVDESIGNADRRVRDSAKPPATAKATVVPPKLPPKQLVLIGAGHAHLQIVNRWPRRRIPGVELTLVSAFGQAASSNMLSGALAGLYRSEQMLIDLPKLCERRGVRLIVDRANSFDPVAREIEFAHQPKLNFDLASINIGSVPSSEELWQSHRIMISAKPLSTFLARFHARFQELVEQWNQAPGTEMLQVVVVGGGAAGVEMAFCLEQRRYDLELPIDVRVVDAHPGILNGFPQTTVRKVKKLFHKRGIEVSPGSRVVDCDDMGPSSLVLENGERIRADLVIWVTGAAPPMSVRGFQLPKSSQGFLTVRSTLQSTANVPVFAVGDVADLVDSSIPKSDLSTARQAAVLQHNLANWFTGRPLAVYRPLRSALSLLSCGDGTAILSYKGFCFHGQWVWRLKDRIDRSWVRKYQMR